MRYKAQPLSTRFPSRQPRPPNRRPARPRDRRSTRGDWIATLPMILLLGMLLVPLLMVSADSLRTDPGASASRDPKEQRTLSHAPRGRGARAAAIPASTPAVEPTPSPTASNPPPTPLPATPAPVPVAPAPTAAPPAPPPTPAPTPAPVAPTPVGGDLQAMVNSAASGATVSYSGSWNGTLTIAKPLTIVGGRVNGSIRIQASDVTLRSMVVIGPQSSVYSGGQNAIYAESVSRVTLDGVEAGNVGDSAVRLHYVTGFTILGPNIHDAVYAGIITTSSTDGLIAGGTVQRIGMNGSAAANSNNAYGIALTRFGFTTPKAARITVRGVTVRDVPTWHGLDTHGGIDLVIEGNRVERAYRGIMITGVGAERVTVRNNVVTQASYIGIAIVDARPYTVTGNTITASPNIGIFAGVEACGAVSGNSVTGSATAILNQSGLC